MSTALPRSASTVALLADIPSTGHVGEVRARRFAMHGDGIGERSAAFVAFAQQETDAGRKVVALYPSWRAADAERAINFARGSQRTDHIAGIALDLSPLALSLVADQLAYLAPYLPPGMVAALCGELPKHLLAGAWLRTVAGLSTIPTTLKHHVGSLAPTVSFLAYCTPTQQVQRMRPADVAATLPFRPVQPVQLLCSTPDPAHTDVFDDHLPQAIQPVATRTLPVQPLGPVYWGTPKYVEFVALSAHPQALAYAASSIRASACSWCGEPVSTKPCPFCAANSTRTSSRTTTPRPARATGHGPATRNGRAVDGPAGGGHTTAAPPAAQAPNEHRPTPGPPPNGHRPTAGPPPSGPWPTPDPAPSGQWPAPTPTPLAEPAPDPEPLPGLPGPSYGTVGAPPAHPPRPLDRSRESSPFSGSAPQPEFPRTYSR
ncbi:hypothetical protein DFP74_6055 [Nocardiopsis sp. Huas11]|uniref:hypothetical protein n=1 Tax=Nocardiopsis sp. Huas11 TaxID=2183912 RepID=UPI000F294CB4|nr:hypothetical protein [Nocardiopsis sp. Huas11]RKS10292.1 hypothetical protein DFP74_6055 [Nocardiopsis sp. Huas11]